MEVQTLIDLSNMKGKIFLEYGLSFGFNVMLVFLMVDISLYADEMKVVTVDKIAAKGKESGLRFLKNPITGKNSTILESWRFDQNEGLFLDGEIRAIIKGSDQFSDKEGRRLKEFFEAKLVITFNSSEDILIFGNSYTFCHIAKGEKSFYVCHDQEMKRVINNLYSGIMLTGT